MAVMSEEFLIEVERFVEAARREIAARSEDAPIRRTPGVCGGVACVRRTRIPVWLIIVARRRGTSEADLLANYPSLVPGDMDAVWAYYRGHVTEIDSDIAAEEADDPVAMSGGTGEPALRG